MLRALISWLLALFVNIYHDLTTIWAVKKKSLKHLVTAWDLFRRQSFNFFVCFLDFGRLLAGAGGTVRLLLRAPLGSGRGRVVLPQSRCGPVWSSPQTWAPPLPLCSPHHEPPASPTTAIDPAGDRPAHTHHPSIHPPPHPPGHPPRFRPPRTLWNPSVFYLWQIPGQLPGRGRQFWTWRSCRGVNFQTSRSIQTLQCGQTFKISLLNCKNVHKYTGCFFHWYPPEKFQVQNS